MFNFKLKAETEIFGITSEKDMNDALEMILTLTKKIEDSDINMSDEATAKLVEIRKILDSIQK